MKKTEIPVTIYTGYQYDEGDSLTNHRQQIEKLGFYLQSIFSLLKSAAREREAELQDYETMVFLNDVEHLSEIGFGIAGAIFPAASQLEILGMQQSESAIKTDAASEIRDASGVQIIAEQVAGLLANEQIPDELHDAIMDGLDKLGAITKHKSLTRVEKSAEFIAHVLRDYREAKEDE